MGWGSEHERVRRRDTRLKHPTSLDVHRRLAAQERLVKRALSTRADRVNPAEDLRTTSTRHGLHDRLRDLRECRIARPRKPKAR